MVLSNLSLLSPAALSKAGLDNKPAIEVFKAEVVASRPEKDGGYQLQLQSGKDSIAVSSERALPKGTVLTLAYRQPSTNQQTSASQQPSTNQQPAPSLEVLATRLPARQVASQAQASPAQQPTLLSRQTTPVSNPSAPYPTAGSVSGATTNDANTQTRLQQAISQLIGSRLLLAPSSSPAQQSLNQLSTSGKAGSDSTMANKLSAAYQQTGASSTSTSGSTATSSSAPTRSQATASLLNQLLVELNSADLKTSDSSRQNHNEKLLQSQLRGFIQQLPSERQLSPASVRTAVEKSGVFHEQQAFQPLRQQGQNSTALNDTNQSAGQIPLASQSAATKAAPTTGSAIELTASSTATGASSNTGNSNLASQLFSAASRIISNSSMTKAASTDGAITYKQTTASLTGNYNQQVGQQLEQQTAGSIDLKTLLTRALMNAGGLAQQPSGLPVPLPSHWPDSHRTGSLQHKLRAALAQIENNQIAMRQTEGQSLLRTLLMFSLGEETRQAELELKREYDNRSLINEQPFERPTESTLNSPCYQNSNAERESQSADAKAEKQQRYCWHLKLHFELPQSGTLDVEINLGWPTLSVTFWSEQAQVRQRLQPAMQPLQSRLVELGAEVEKLEVRHGSIPLNQQNRIEQRLVDLHT